MPPGPVQTSVNVVAPVSAEEFSVPDGGRLPVHPFDAVQAVASVLVHVSAVVPLDSTKVVIRIAAGAEAPIEGSEIRLDAWAHRRHHFDPDTGQRVEL